MKTKPKTRLTKCVSAGHWLVQRNSDQQWYALHRRSYPVRLGQYETFQESWFIYRINGPDTTPQVGPALHSKPTKEKAIKFVLSGGV